MCIQNHLYEVECYKCLNLFITHSVHYLCRAVIDHSAGKDLPSLSVESFENLPGRGVFATLSSTEVWHL